MARQQTAKAGACSSHTLAVKANCLQHARRDGKLPSNVIPDRVKDDITVFESDVIKGRKSIMPLIRAAEKKYTEKTGQKCQKSFTPYRESVLHINSNVTPEQLLDFKVQCEELMGWKVLGIWMHKDEGHARSKYIEGDTDFSVHEHAHILWDCTDPETGKSIRPTRKHFSGMQDLLAACTGMERGNKAADTGIGYRKAAEERIAKIEARLATLEKILEEKNAEIAEKDSTIEGQQQLLDEIAQEIGNLSKAKALKKASIAKLEEFAERAKAAGAKAKAAGIVAVEGAKAAGAAAAESTKAVGNWVMSKFNLSDKDDTIREQAAKIDTLTKERDEALQKASTAFTNGKQSAFNEVYSIGGWDATQSRKDEHNLHNIQFHLSKERDERRELSESRDAWKKAYQDLKGQTDDQSQSQGMKR